MLALKKITMYIAKLIVLNAVFEIIEMTQMKQV
jgi:hypothetical protein